MPIPANIVTTLIKNTPPKNTTLIIVFYLMLGLIGFVRSIEETPATIDSIVLHPIFQGALPIAVR